MLRKLVLLKLVLLVFTLLAPMFDSPAPNFHIDLPPSPRVQPRPLAIRRIPMRSMQSVTRRRAAPRPPIGGRMENKEKVVAIRSQRVNACMLAPTRLHTYPLCSNASAHVSALRVLRLYLDQSATLDPA